MQARSTFRSLRRFVLTVVTLAPRLTAATAAVTLVLTATEGIGLLLLIPLLQLVGVNGGAPGTDRLATLIASAFQSVGLQPTLGLVLLVYLGTVAVQGMLQRRETMLRTRVQQQLVYTLRNRLYAAIAGAQWTYFARSRASDYTHVLTEEVDRVGAGAYHVVDLAVTAATVLVYVALAFRVSPPMTALVLLCGAGLALTMRSRLGAARAAGEALSASWSRLYAAIAEHLGSLKIAKSYGAERRHGDAFEALSHDLAHVGQTSAQSQARFGQELAFGSAAVLAVIVYVSHTMLAVSTARLLLLLFLFARLIPRLTGMYTRAQALANVLPSFDVVIDTESRARAAGEPKVEHPAAMVFSRSIELDRVTFDYHEDGRFPAVQDVSLTIAAGATTAIVGPSGAGKSTLADLLLGLLPPSRGRILVDGVRLDADRLAAWRDQIGYVTQDTFLFHASVRANLLWARPDANEEDIWRALGLASAEDFVRALPQGLDTLVGDRGVLVSGGERQRLSLARALLRRPSLLILDEATSSLDSENEARIQSAIDDLHQRMTIVIITHRLSTIRGADLIHVIDRGRLAESGTWAELMAQRTGRFRELCAAQGIHPPAVGGRRFEVVGR